VSELRQRVRVTHPFHPLSGQQFEVVTYRRSWGGQPVVDCLDGEGRLVAIPLAWTDAAADDPFVALSAGRAAFRVEDLLRLIGLVAAAQEHDFCPGSSPQEVSSE
jgi:hypothetical protein